MENPPKRRKGTDNDQEEARKRERQAAVVARVQHLDQDGVCSFLDQVADRWLTPGTSYESVVDKAFMNFGIPISGDLDTDDIGSFGLRKIDELIHDHEMEVIALYHQCRAVKLEDEEVIQRVVRCIEQVYYAKRLVLSVFQSKLAVAHMHAGDALDLDGDLDARLGSWSLRFRWINDDTNTLQKLLLYLLDQALEKKYRRHGSWVYEPIVIDGHRTHAWRSVMEIKEWVYSECRKETAWQQWTWLTQGGNSKAVIDYLTSCQDYSFPVLQKTRHVFAFRNGVYLAKTDAWHDFETSTEPLSDNIVAAKFFDTELGDVSMPWRDIPTPFLDSIMDYQGFSTEVKRWMFILLGRLLYNVNELDGWQVIPFFKGAASSGKSTLVLRVAKQFYEAIDVGCLSNNVERKFGLSAFHDKFLFVAPEIKSDLVLEQAEFQSMCSGEDITINTKFQKAYSKCWTTPGVLAGNEVPGWCDNAGSIQRRIILFDFHKQVTAGDARLGDKLETELPKVLVKCNRAYLEAVRAWGDANIWTVVPEYFKNTRDSLAQQTNVVEGFLGSGDVVFGEAMFCPMEEFKLALKAFVQQNNYKAIKLTWDVFRGPLEKYNITKKRETLEYNGRKLTRDYLHGVDIACATEAAL